ncbi:MAG: hypothetical protein CME61_03705, partial [Halobacteriovoraceae bacterium]|nr:hypothetical protein [Halobacteriovoraceae bacterium]
NLKIGFVGDCLRGRTVHSLAKLMSKFDGNEFYFLAPKDLQIDNHTHNFILKNSPKSKVTLDSDGLHQTLPELDVVYMTRIQDEHGGRDLYPEKFRFKKGDLDSMKDGAILMHPMPKRDEIDPEIDYLKRDERVMYWRQQRNGMWIRAALFVYLFKKDDAILNLV